MPFGFLDQGGNRQWQQIARNVILRETATFLRLYKCSPLLAFACLLYEPFQTKSGHYQIEASGILKLASVTDLYAL